MASCTTTVPAGVFVCTTDDDCPDRQRCTQGGLCDVSAKASAVRPVQPVADGGPTPRAGAGGDAAGTGGDATPRAGSSAPTTNTGENGGASASAGAQGGSAAAGAGATAGASAGGPSDPAMPPPDANDPPAASAESPGIAALGASCSQPDVPACVALDSLKRLRCDGNTWVDDGACPWDARNFCDGSPGTGGHCRQFNAPGCGGAQAGGTVCVGTNVYRCDQQGSDATLITECAGDTPNCLQGQCSCGAICDGKCRALQTDPQHCGSCGNDCRGGSCEEGQCQPAVLVRGAYVSEAMCADDKHVYWIEAPNPQQQQQRRVRKVAQAGGDVVELTSFNIKNGSLEMVCDGAFVYWSNYDDGTVWKVPVDGGTVSLIASNVVQVWKLAQDETNIYWVSGPGNEVHDVMKAPKTGGTASVVTSYVRPFEIVSSGGYLYFGTGDGYQLIRVSRDGGEVMPFDANGYVHALGVNEGQLYLAEFQFGVSRMPLPGGPIMPVNDAAADQAILDYPYVYWRIDGGLQRRSLTGGAEESFVRFSGDASWPNAFAVAGSHVFVGRGSHLYAIPK
ncbi:MAG: hypothetical protein ABW321_26555 [Polyangiales bacterium]